MTETVKEGDIGRIFIVGTGGFDVSGNTELKMVFKKPDLVVITKLKADGVSAPVVPITVDVDGVLTTFEAGEYLKYISVAGLFDLTGVWSIHAEYVDATPKDFAGTVTNFTVLPRE